MRRGRFIFGWCHNDRDRVAKFHDIVDEDLNEVSARDFKLDLGEHGDVGRMEGGILECEFNFSLAQDGGLIRRDQPHAFGELAQAGGPTVKETQFEGHDRQLRHADEIDNPNEKEIPGYFLANLFA